MKKTIDGVTYEAVPEVKLSSCKGCVAYGNSQLCKALDPNPEPDCGCLGHRHIWRAEQEQHEHVVTVRLAFKEGTSREEAEENARDIIYDGLRTAPAPHPVSWRIEK